MAVKQSKNSKFVYSGRENLEAMKEAKNYNAYLIGLVKQVLKNVPTKKARILDFGAGAGTYADILRKKGINVECLEPDNVSRKSLKKKGYKTIIDSKKLKPNTYDLIYTFNVLEHIKNDKEVMRELTSSLKKEGAIVIYVPAFDYLFSSMDKLVGHFRRYNLDTLKKYSKKNKLKIIKLGYCDPLGFFVTLLYKLVGNKRGIISKSNVKFYDKYIFPISRFLEPATRNIFGKNAVLIGKEDID